MYPSRYLDVLLQSPKFQFNMWLNLNISLIFHRIKHTYLSPEFLAVVVRVPVPLLFSMVMCTKFYIALFPVPLVGRVPLPRYGVLQVCSWLAQILLTFVHSWASWFFGISIDCWVALEWHPRAKPWAREYEMLYVQLTPRNSSAGKRKAEKKIS